MSPKRSETLSWDVRTVQVTHDYISTLDNIQGLAVSGPEATLFTLDVNNTVQQFDLKAPFIMGCKRSAPNRPRLTATSTLTSGAGLELIRGNPSL